MHSLESRFHHRLKVLSSLASCLGLLPGACLFNSKSSATAKWRAASCLPEAWRLKEGAVFGDLVDADYTSGEQMLYAAFCTHLGLRTLKTVGLGIKIRCRGESGLRFLL